jgi:hypothetical protein
MFTDVLPMVTDVYPMVTDVYPMVAEESSVANPQKVAKIDENIRKMQKNGLATLYLPRNYPIPRYYRKSSMASVVIGGID